MLNNINTIGNSIWPLQFVKWCKITRSCDSLCDRFLNIWYCLVPSTYDLECRMIFLPSFFLNISFITSENYLETKCSTSSCAETVTYELTGLFQLHEPINYLCDRFSSHLVLPSSFDLWLWMSYDIFALFFLFFYHFKLLRWTVNASYKLNCIIQSSHFAIALPKQILYLHI